MSRAKELLAKIREDNKLCENSLTNVVTAIRKFIKAETDLNKKREEILKRAAKGKSSLNDAEVESMKKSLKNSETALKITSKTRSELEKL